MRMILRSTIATVGACLVAAFTPASAAACGGFFCDQAQPVNQAAEGIIFAQNDDGTVTAVIQIKYQGPSQSFSWLLPISSVPKSDADIGVASNLAFQRLQTATNPAYTLTTKIEGTCRPDKGGPLGSAGAAAAAEGGSGGEADSVGGVTVEASGVVGSFEWTVISLDKSLPNPADVAVSWLTENGYDVPGSAPKLLASYLQQGLYLLALRLTKGASVGSIRPIILTYEGTHPSIPVKLTAVAANDDMGVLTWVLGKSRAVPQNYLSLELNEARINWFNANSNYNSVVIDAANDAGGQGFVTEFSGSSSTLKSQIWTLSDETNWSSFKTTTFTTAAAFFNRAYPMYSAFDGFWDATRAAVTLPSGVSFAQLQTCPSCYANQISFTPATYLAELDKTVIQPVKRVQDLIDAHPQLTRMYTTLSADEMTLDPLFDFNADLPKVSNVHSAVRVIECNSHVGFGQAPWRIELPQGGVLRGTAAQVGSWPAELSQLPPNRLIVRAGQSGPGKVVEDNSDQINESLTAYNAGLPMPVAEGGAGGVSNGIVGAGGNGEGGDHMTMRSGSDSGGCNIAGAGDPASAFVAASALALALLRRRRN